MKRQYQGQFLDPHSLLRLLVATAVVAFELVVATEGLCVAEAFQAVGDAGVLAYVHLGIGELDLLHSDLMSSEHIIMKNLRF